MFKDASEDEKGTSWYVADVNKNSAPYISGHYTMVAKSKTSELAHKHRQHSFQTTAIRKQFRFNAAGTKVSTSSKSNIPKRTIPIPFLPEQTAIAVILYDMGAALPALEVSRAKTRPIEWAMMQELLTGRTRLV